MVLAIPPYEPMAMTTPFTTRDNLSYLQKVNLIRGKLNEHIANTSITYLDLVDRLNADFAALGIQWNAELYTVRNEVIEQLGIPGTPAHNAIVTAAGSVYDPATAALVGDEESATGVALASRMTAHNAPLVADVAALDTQTQTLDANVTVLSGDLTAFDSDISDTSSALWKRVSKTLPTINVRAFGAIGDGIADDTDAFNAALDANPGGTVVVPSGTYLIDATRNAGGRERPVGVELKTAGTALVLSDDATLICKPTSSDYYAVVEMSAPDTSISGGTIIGDLLSHTGTTGEYGFCIHVTPEADRAKISDMSLSYAWGDCVMVGEGPTSAWESVQVPDVVIENVHMDHARRNNLSLIACKDMRVIGCTFTNAGRVNGTAPRCGVDVEPNPDTTQDVINASFINCVFADNIAHGFGNIASNRTSTVTVNNCESRDNGAHGYTINGNAETAFYNCVASDNGGSGFTTDVGYTNRESTYHNCRAIRNASVGFGVVGGMQAFGCTASDNVVGGFLASGNARLTGCTSKGNNTGVSQYYGNFASEGGAGAAFVGCHSDAGNNPTKPDWGFRVLPSTATTLVGCSSVGTYGIAAFANAGTGTVANPVPGKAGGVVGATVATAAPAAGGGGALPATPVGYYTVNINGTDRQVAYY